MNRIGKFRWSLIFLAGLMSCHQKGTSSSQVDGATTSKNTATINFSDGVKEIREWFNYVTPVVSEYKPVTIYTREEFERQLKNEPEKVTALFLDFRINKEEAKLVDVKRIKEFKNLEYFETLGFERMPVEIYSLKKLRVLHVDADLDSIVAITSLKDLEEISVGWTHNIFPPTIKNLSKLRTLRLHGCPQRYCNDIFEVPNLESLWIEFDDSTQLKGISKLKKLKCLMTNIATKEVGELTQLTGLNIDGGVQREFSMELGKLQSLVAFGIHANVSIQHAPEFVAQLKNLEYIEIRNCDMLTVIPDSYNQLGKLKMFKIHYNGIYEVPKNLSAISNVVDVENIK